MNQRSLKKELVECLGITEDLVDRIVVRAPHTYKVYTIPKKSGGERVIAQPAKETKYIQNWLIKNVFSKLPVHDVATAYKKGASIALNAVAHSKNQYLLKLDFKDFFNSITEDDLLKHFAKYLGNNYSIYDFKTLARVSTIHLKGRTEKCLSIGAPSSPILSNSIMFEFDALMSEWCISSNITYTRYADDLTFSTNTKNISLDIENWVKKTIKEISYPSLKINDKKTTHLSKKHQRRVTGVVINNSGDISLGRTRKRAISSLVHKYLLKNLNNDQILELQGMLGFAKDVEPQFLVRLRKKYGEDVIGEILKRRKN